MHIKKTFFGFDIFSQLQWHGAGHGAGVFSLDVPNGMG